MRYTSRLTEAGLNASIGTVGDSYDNALPETTNGLYKTEAIRTTIFHQGPFKTIADIEYATAEWAGWYNNRRLHSRLNDQAPAEYEAAHYQALNREPQPA